MSLALWLWSCATAPPPPDPTAVSPAEPAAAPACETCHAEEHAAWTGSHHALAERDVGEDDTWATELGAVRLIGVDPVVQGLVPAENGRLQAHQEAFDPRDGTRFDIFTDDRQPGEWGHWTGGGMTWNGRCAACHVTGLEKGFDGTTFDTTYTALGVTCEACHGDADAHARGGPPPANPRMFDTCASCHARRAELTGDFEPGDAFLDHYVPVLLDDTAVFAADGRARDEAFEWNQFVASPMHTGGARCSGCHDPHSGALLREGDALCAECHGGLEAHGEGACVDCHMPYNRLMARHDRRDHGFTRPDDTRFAAFETARTGGGWTDLDLDAPDSGRRAAHVSALGLYPDDAEARAALRNALADPDPLVRTAAANALVPAEPADLDALEKTAEKGAVRAERVAAQRALVQVGFPFSRAVDYQRYLDHNADDPNARAERGLLRVRAGDPRGLEDLDAATTLDPSSPDLVVLQGIGLSTAGKTRQAVEVLEGGVMAFPAHVELRQSLGLAYAATGRDADAIATLERVVADEPQRGRAWRNLALLYAKQRRIPDAKAAGARAAALLPDDPEFRTWVETLK